MVFFYINQLFFAFVFFVEQLRVRMMDEAIELRSHEKSRYLYVPHFLRELQVLEVDVFF